LQKLESIVYDLTYLYYAQGAAVGADAQDVGTVMLSASAALVTG